ncbi:MAG: hypothetical protein J0L62_03550 [Bacteroidetes bacterium]|nr:hypothetical protein [Bacteroidota bacterium]
MKINSFLFPFILLNWLVFNGCTSDYTRYSSKGMYLSQNIKTIGIVTPDLDIFELSAGGSSERLGAESEKARLLILNGFTSELKKSGIDVKLIEVKGPDSIRLDETLAMFKTVNDVILSKNTDETRWKFEFDIGSVDSLATLYQVDGFLFIQGYETRNSTGRNIAATAGVITGVLVGVGTVYHNPYLISIGLTDRKGKILFHNHQSGKDGSKWALDDSEEVTEMSEFLFEKYHEGLKTVFKLPKKK